MSPARVLHVVKPITVWPLPHARQLTEIISSFHRAVIPCVLENFIAGLLNFQQINACTVLQLNLSGLNRGRTLVSDVLYHFLFRPRPAPGCEQAPARWATGARPGWYLGQSIHLEEIFLSERPAINLDHSIYHVNPARCVWISMDRHSQVFSVFQHFRCQARTCSIDFSLFAMRFPE